MCCCVLHSFHKDLPLYHHVKYEIGSVLIKKWLLLRCWLGLETFFITLEDISLGWCVCVCFGRFSCFIKEFIAYFSSWDTNWFRQVESEWEEEISKDFFFSVHRDKHMLSIWVQRVRMQQSDLSLPLWLTCRNLGAASEGKKKKNTKGKTTVSTGELL